LRIVGLLLVLLLLLGWLACDLPLPGAPPQVVDEPQWRRTAVGWEVPNWPQPDTAEHRPTLHPAVVALLELLASCAALVAGSGEWGVRSRE